MLLIHHPIHEQLSTKAKNRLRYCQLTTAEELRAFLNDPKSMRSSIGVGPVTMNEFAAFLDAVDTSRKQKK